MNTVDQQPDTDIDETGTWLSIGDIMSALLMIFALILIVTLLQLKETVEKMQSTRIVIIQSLQKTLSETGINAEIDPTTGDISILDSVLFDPGESRLKPVGKSFLRKFVPVYSEVIFSDSSVEEQIQYVVVEGHTSSLGRWDYNMALSLDRAQSVTQHISEMRFANQKNFLRKILVSGRGEVEADQERDAQKDRKVIFRFQFKSDTFPRWFDQHLGSRPG